MQKIADEDKKDVKHIDMIFMARTYRGGHNNNQSLESIGMKDHAQVILAQKFCGGGTMCPK